VHARTGRRRSALALAIGTCGLAFTGVSAVAAQLPAAAVIIGVAALAFGALPDACVAVGWTAVGLAVALNILGQAGQLSHWVLDISPFTDTPKLPGGTVTATPLISLNVIALALCAVGLAAFAPPRHRLAVPFSSPDRDGCGTGPVIGGPLPHPSGVGGWPWSAVRTVCGLWPFFRTASWCRVPYAGLPGALRWVADGLLDAGKCPVMRYFAKIFTLNGTLICPIR
jgi:hypothetical protein